MPEAICHVMFYVLHILSWKDNMGKYMENVQLTQFIKHRNLRLQQLSPIFDPKL